MATQSNHIKKLIADLYVHFTLTELSAYKEVKDLFKISEEYSPANLDVLNRASVSSPQNISDNPAITEFISFLEQCCHQLRTDSDFAPYFSFPSNPLSHHLFCEASQVCKILHFTCIIVILIIHFSLPYLYQKTTLLVRTSGSQV